MLVARYIFWGKVLVARNTFAKLPLWMLGFLY